MDDAHFVKMTKGINADFLMRLSPNRCVYAQPPKYQGKGRPRKHGQKMKLSAPTTWGIPVESVEINDPTWGIVEITRWSKFHFCQSASQPMEIVLIMMEESRLYFLYANCTFSRTKNVVIDRTDSISYN